jgi:hypothetical protein
MRVVCRFPVGPVRRLMLAFATAVVVTLYGGGGPEERSFAQGCDPTLQNEIVCENLLPGAPASEWEVVGAGDSSIQGFATDISVNRGSTVRFKIDTNAASYRIDIYRLGYYGGMGARKVATITPSAALPQRQPNCLSNAATGLVDCGNWGVSASWAVPANAVSGLYVARPVRTDTGGASHIPFVVRDDGGSSDLLFQTSDTTWQAYNRYGGNSLYAGSSGVAFDRAVKVSYNRPFTTREYAPEDWIFNAEYPMIRWLESNGYDVSYFTGIDADRLGSEILEHKVFVAVGHDEYWSGKQRAHVEAARGASPPVHLAFFSGNEVFWKIRWEPSIDGSATSHRTLVSYKETHANGKIDPALDPVTGQPIWTGTWRDPRFSPPGDGGRPENGLTGTIFKVNSGTSGIGVPAEFGKHRFWRNTTIATMAPGTTVNLPNGTLGYEWDEAPNNGVQPPGLMRLSRRTVAGVETLLDFGNTYGAGTATHSLTLYRHQSGALVFGAGTVQWSWGLDNNHDRGSAAPDTRMRQATVNLFADMDVLPRTIQSGLVLTSPSTDTLAPTSTITSPADGASIASRSTVTISGTAIDDGGGVVSAVEVSTDGGATWHPATGTSAWTFSWVANVNGTFTIQSRAWDDTGNRELPIAGVTVTVGGGGGTPRVCPCSVWNPTDVPSRMENDASAVEVGMKFRTEKDGVITGVRFYKYGQNTGTHVGNLWTRTGQRLATVTFTNESASGWQQANFSTPVPVTANTTYIVSYHTRVGFYGVNTQFFTADHNNPPLRALFDGEDGPNGLYLYTATSAFPTNTFQSENYWVDVVFSDSVQQDTTRPTITATSPAGGTTSVATNASVTATFSERIDPATVSSATFELRDSANTLVPATISYDDASRRATLDPAANLKAATTYTARIRGGVADPRVKDLAGNALLSDLSWTFTTSAAPPPSDGCPCTIWPSTTVPDHMQADFSPVELGVRFQSSTAGYISGVRFYKYAQNGGPHTGNLWSNTGQRLATAIFTNETASGWQEVLFDTPVPITPNTTYIASYHTPSGGYAVNNSYFANGATTRGPLSALQDGTDGPNGLYRYAATSDAVPNQTFLSNNYWVDVVFVSRLSDDTTAPQVTTTSPASGAVDVSVSATLSAIFSESLAPESVTADTFLLETSAGIPIPAAVSYDEASLTATLVPGSPLDHTTAYRAVLKGAISEPRITDAAGNPLEADYTWTFTTAAAPPPPSSISIAETSAVEGTDSVAGELRFTVTLSRESSEAVTVDFATAGGTAAPGSDYLERTGTLTFAPGNTAQTIAVSLLADAIDEQDETIVVTLTNPTGATIGVGQATGVIQDDDAEPSVSIADVSIAEGNAAVANATFTVSLSAASGQTVTLSYSTVSVSASEGIDYTPVSGTLTFAPGVTSQPIVVPVIGDGVHEHDEIFEVNLAGAVNGTVARVQGLGTIVNDDGAPSISVADISVAEGHAGTSAATFLLTLSAPSDLAASVNYTTADGTATSGSDYTAASGTASFAPGATTAEITVLVSGDAIRESDETFVLTLAGPVGASIADGQATGTIVNDEEVPTISVGDVSIAEGNAASAALTFSLTLSGASDLPVTVNYATSDGTATSPSDYEAGSGFVTLGPGMVSAEITVPVSGDTVHERNENFVVTLSAPENAAIGDGQATATIVNDDAVPAISIADVSVGEGDAGATMATFVLALSGSSELPVSVSYTTKNGTAIAGSDYSAASGSASFAPGATSTQIGVPVSGDAVRELDETFGMSLTDAVNATIADGEATATIVNDDVMPSISIGDVSVTEGAAGTTAANFTLTLSGPTDLPVSVTYSTADGTATAGSDYTAASGTVSFAPGATSTEVAVLVAGDALRELDETFVISLAEAVNATIADGQATGTIVNDEGIPSISIADVTVSEGNAGTIAATFALALSGPSDLPVSVNYATADGTATAGTDYAALSGAASFAPGVTTTEVTVLVNGDVVHEGDENFLLTLSGAANATTTDGQATATIVNDDAAPTITVSDVLVNEGDAGTTAATFTVALSGPSELPISVSYTTANGTAAAGSDYTAASGTASLVPGATSTEVTVTVAGDTGRELDETFTLSLATAVNAAIGDGLATATIVNDDAMPSISVADVAVNEGNEGPSVATFVLALSAATELPVTVSYSTADGTATAGSDYTAVSGTASFAPGATSTEISVLVAGDAVRELDETFVLGLADAVNATIAVGQATATIANDEGLPSISVANVSVNEGNAGTTAATFLLTLTAPSDLPVSVNYATGDGSAIAGSDYMPANGVASFAAGVVTAEVTVLVNGDALVEGDEAFVLALTAPTNATLANAQATATITNDEPMPTISITGASVTEGNAGAAAATFALTLSGASELPVTVSYQTSDATASAGVDYIASAGAATFAPGTMATEVTVLVNGDVLFEADEAFNVALTDPVNATVLQGQASGTIVNDDAVPVPLEVSIADASIAEGNSGTTNLTFDITLSVPSAMPVSISYVTNDGTATAAADYQQTSGTLVIPAGALSGTIVVPVNGDTQLESNETLTVTLTAADLVLVRSSGTGLIVNDDVVAVEGLVAAYNFDQRDGTSLPDSSGSGLHGIVSGAQWAEGRTGGALFFDGVNDWVRVGDDDRLDVRRMTISAWVRPTVLSGWDTIVTKGTAGSVTYALYASDDTRRPAAHVTIDQNLRAVEGPFPLGINEWVHLTTSFDGSRVKFYINGVLIRTGARTGLIDTSTGILSIGGSQALGRYFAGLIDDVRVYNRALSDAEVQADMNTPVP